MKLLHDALALHAERSPEQDAVVLRDQTLSYRALDTLSNQLASVLQDRGVVPGDRVCLAIPKSPLVLVAALGTLKAGAICVPLDLQSPPGRAAKVFQVCQPRVVLACGATGSLIAQLATAGEPLPPYAIGWLDAQPTELPTSFVLSEVQGQPSNPPTRRVQPDDCAYILFTSGTTGVPKGVMMRHSSILRFNEWAVQYFQVGPNDRLSGNFALNFDPSLFDVYGTLLAGATLYQVPPELHLLPVALAQFVRDKRLTFWWSVPAVLAYLAKFDAVRQGDFPSLTRVLWIGEVCPTPILRHLMRRLPQARFTNLYGPTETAIASTYHTLPALPETDADDVPIGEPCPGEHTLVLDEARAPLPLGEVGELNIGGVGLSPGYWGNPRETDNAFWQREDGRWYRTGDLVRTGRDGLLYFVGRKDSQVKVRGYRIELGDVEATANAIGLLSEACVVAARNAEGVLICCAYVPQDKNSPTLETIRGELARRLPPYMLPSRWRAYAAIPRNANGKMDRPRLVRDFQDAAS
jgi:amino acid adenylation domain-containing protein